MSDLQAKYNALLRKFIGDHIFVDHATDVEVSKDIAATMQEKARRVERGAKISQDTVRQMSEDRMKHVSALQALTEESQRLRLYDMELSK